MWAVFKKLGNRWLKKRIFLRYYISQGVIAEILYKWVRLHLRLLLVTRDVQWTNPFMTIKIFYWDRQYDIVIFSFRYSLSTRIREGNTKLLFLSTTSRIFRCGGRSKRAHGTVYQKHRSLRTRKWMYRGWLLPSAGRLRRRLHGLNWSPSERRR